MQLPQLSAHQITKTYAQDTENVLCVLKSITIDFSHNKTCAIMGVSGTGKSTFMHILAGLDSPTSGHITYNQKNIDTLPLKERCEFLNKTVGLMFQSPHLINELSVEENVMLPGLIAHQKREWCQMRARELLATVGLHTKYQSPPATLSGGQQQRVALARALFNKPAFLLADEPTGNLDVATGKQIVELLMACQREWGMGMIISTHDEYIAQQMNEIYLIIDGNLQKQTMNYDILRKNAENLPPL
jgi:ABC-type lipoprotein export system ATPase subunit